MKSGALLLAIAVAVIACVMIMPEASAEEEHEIVTKDGLTYDINHTTNTAVLFSVSAFSDPSGNLVIPDHVPDTAIPVTTIEEGAIDLEGIRSVTIGNNITDIEHNAFISPTIERFYECAGPSSFEVVDDVLFKVDVASYSLIRYPAAKAGDAYVISNTVTELYGGAFSNCKNLTRIDFEAGSTITEIPSNTFYGCSNLARMNYDDSDKYNHLPDKVLIIENSAFAECRALGNVMFPDNLRLVEAYAFYGCGAEKFHLDWNLYFLGISVFSDCQNLTTFESDLDIIYTGSGSFEVDKDGVLFENGNGNATRKLLCYPAGKTDEKYTIPEKTTHIAWGAFYGNKHLKEVTINDKISLIDISAFEECTGLETVNLSKSVTVIESNAFASCTSLTALNGMTNVTEIGSSAFKKVAITEITLPDTIRSVRYSAFEFSKLVKVTVPDTEVSIHTGAFIGCRDLTDIYFEGDRMQFENGSLDVGLSAEDVVEYTVHIIRTASIPSDAVTDEYTILHIDKEGEHPYPYENFIGVAICLLALFGVVMVIREV